MYDWKTNFLGKLILAWIVFDNSGIDLDMGLANEGKQYILMLPLIGWAHTQNDPCD